MRNCGARDRSLQLDGAYLGKIKPSQLPVLTKEHVAQSDSEVFLIISVGTAEGRGEEEYNAPRRLQPVVYR